MMRKAQGFGSLWHLATRFFGSVLPVGPPKSAEGWATSHLLPGEASLFAAMSGADRRHAIGVARRAIGLLGSPGLPDETPDRAFIAAGLLHDVGKIEARLGTFGRVGATVMAVVFGREKLVAWGHPRTGAMVGAGAGDQAPEATTIETVPASSPAPWTIQGLKARMGLYLMHDSIGARLLEGAGSETLTFKWAREHHLPESRWSIDQRLGHALKEADDD
jgi:hypothetical protein